MFPPYATCKLTDFYVIGTWAVNGLIAEAPIERCSEAVLRRCSSK